jgi:hypothetical protein
MSDEEPDFKKDLEDALGDAMRASDEICSQVWSALANIIWTHSSGEEFSCSFRYAGGLIAEIVDKGTYMDWYCSGPYAKVNELVSNAMLEKGWKHREWNDEDYK